jgi:hypothetical protein
MTDTNDTGGQTKADRQKGLNAAYSAASKRLREAHQDEFNSLYQQEAADRGIEWTPKATPEQKAEQEMQALLAQFPHLVGKLTALQG